MTIFIIFHLRYAELEIHTIISYIDKWNSKTAAFEILYPKNYRDK